MQYCALKSKLFFIVDNDLLICCRHCFPHMYLSK